MSTFEKVDGQLKETKSVGVVHNIEQLKMERMMAVEQKDRTVKECDAIIARIDALLGEAVKVGIEVE